MDYFLEYKKKRKQKCIILEKCEYKIKKTSDRTLLVDVFLYVLKKQSIELYYMHTTSLGRRAFRPRA